MKEVFPFFRLSRELRDQIYEEVGGRQPKIKLMMPRGTGSSTIPTLENFNMPVSVVAWVIDAPRTDMLLVCGQFKEEYETELRRHLTTRICAIRTSDEPASRVSTAQPEHDMNGETFAMSWLRQASQLTIDLSVPFGPRHSLGLLGMEYNAIVECLKPNLSNLRLLFLDFYLDVRNFSHEQEQLHLLQICKGTIHNFISTHGDAAERAVTIQPRFIVYNQLFSLLPVYQPTLQDMKRWPLQFNHRTWEEICHDCGELAVATYDVGLSEIMLSDEHFELNLLHANCSDVSELLDNREQQLKTCFEQPPEWHVDADDWTLVGSDAINAERADSVISEEDAAEDDSDEDHFAEAMGGVRIEHDSPHQHES